MRLDINAKYCITSDERQYIINQKGVAGEKSDNPGEETLRPLGYFGTLNSCLKFMVNREILKSDCTTFRELRGLVNSLHDEIDQACDFEPVRRS